MKNLPAALLSSLESVQGFDHAAFVHAHEQSPVTSVRMHPLKSVLQEEGNKKVPWCTTGLYLPSRPVFTLDPAYHAGAYYVQEASSMFLDYVVRQILPERNNLRVLDLCAAPGGKTTLLASLLDESSLLISNEVIRSRASILEENVVRWGYTNNWVTSNDPKDFGKLDGYFDLMVIDAPCSGSGLFRKDERALEEWSEANVLLCSQRQQRIITDVWNALKENGYLVYATCSYSPEENEQILDWLSDNFTVTTVTIDVPEEWGIVTTISRKGLTGYRFFPDKVNGEGFFIAVVQNTQPAKTAAYPKFKSLYDKKTADKASFLLDDSSRFLIQPGKDHYYAIHKQHEPDFHLLSKSVYFRKTGAPLGNDTPKEWLPAHEIALSVDRSKELPFVTLNKEQALKFLKKEEMNIVPGQKGWYLVGYESLALGWIKSLGNRINNYLPKHWRIRMELPSDWE